MCFGKGKPSVKRPQPDRARSRIPRKASLRKGQPPTKGFNNPFSSTLRNRNSIEQPKSVTWTPSFSNAQNLRDGRSYRLTRMTLELIRAGESQDSADCKNREILTRYCSNGENCSLSGIWVRNKLTSKLLGLMGLIFDGHISGSRAMA